MDSERQVLALTEKIRKKYGVEGVSLALLKLEELLECEPPEEVSLGRLAGQGE